MMKRNAEFEEVSDLAKRFEEEDAIVRIALEGTDRVFFVQKALLCNASDYFTKALRSGFLEKHTKSLTLPGCDVETLAMFLYWLCNRELPDRVHQVEDVLDAQDDREASTKRQLLLIKLWIFADSHLIRKLQNVAMDHLYQLLRKNYVDAEVFRLTFALTPEGSPLRAIVVEAAMHDYRATTPYGDPVYSDADLDMLGAIPGVMAALLKAACVCNISDSLCSNEWTNCERGGANGSDTVLQRYLVPEP